MNSEINPLVEPDPDFKSILANTDENEHWALIRDWLKIYPLPFCEYLRSNHPFFITPTCVLISSYNQVIEALNQPEIFSVQLYKPKMGSYLMTEDNTPIHNEDKAIMSALLSREEIPAVRDFIAQAAHSLLNEGQHFELVNEYSRVVPAMMVQSVFGLDGTSVKNLIGWSYWNQYSAFRNQHFHIAENSKAVERSKFRSNAMAAFYMLRLLARKYWRIKIGQPDDDSVTRLLQVKFPKHGTLQLFRKALNSGGLLIGAIETTSEAVVHILSELNKRPDIFAEAKKLAQNDNPEQFDLLCWEALRHKPIAPYIFRKMAQDYEFADKNGATVKLQKGQTVLCLIASAMFDEAAFESPNTFDITRPFGKSFHFGHGHHSCLGYAIGMVMVPEMVRQLFRQPNFHIKKDFEYLGKPFPEQMYVSWG